MSTPTNKPTSAGRTLNDFEFIVDPKSRSSRLGKGSFASVKLAREKKTNNYYALKIMTTKASRSHLQSMYNEIQIHKQLDHPNIIKFHECFQEGVEMYHVLELAQNGTLYNFIHRKKILTPNEVFQFFYQTCLAVQYIHRKDILHRDLKPENILLDKEQNIKLCDFGWSARNINQKRTTFCGTYEYMAPEIVNKKTYDYRVDIWSLGILLYELTHGEAPYKGRSLEEIIKSLRETTTIKFAATVQNEVKDLVQKILKHNPVDRISIDEILSHPWIQYHLEKNQPEQAQLDITLPKEIINSKSTPNIAYQPAQNIAKPAKEAVRETQLNNENFTESDDAHNIPMLNVIHSSSAKRFIPHTNRPEQLKINHSPRNLMNVVAYDNQPKSSLLQTPGATTMRSLYERSQSDAIHYPLSATIARPDELHQIHIELGTPYDIGRRKATEGNITPLNFSSQAYNSLGYMSSPTSRPETPINNILDMLNTSVNPLSTRSPNQQKSETKVHYSSKPDDQYLSKTLNTKEFAQINLLAAPQSPFAKEKKLLKTGDLSSGKKDSSSKGYYLNISNPRFNDLSANAKTELSQTIASPTYKINYTSSKAKVESTKAGQNKHLAFESHSASAAKLYDAVKKNGGRHVIEQLGGSASKKYRSGEKNNFTTIQNATLNFDQRDEVVKRLNFDAMDNHKVVYTERAHKNKENTLGTFKNTKVYINLDKLNTHR